MNNEKKIVFVDMDGVLADFNGSLAIFSKDPIEMYKEGFFRNLEVMPGAKEGIKALLKNKNLDVYIATKHLTKTDYCASEKVGWVREHFPMLVKKMFMVTNKDLLLGDYLIDDDLKWKNFYGHFIHFDHTKPEIEWKRVVEMLNE